MILKEGETHAFTSSGRAQLNFLFIRLCIRKQSVINKAMRKGKRLESDNKIKINFSSSYLAITY